MAPKAKSKPTRFVFTVGTALATALTILAVTAAWALAAPSASLIYRPELPLLY
jgi:hypothetical protein